MVDSSGRYQQERQAVDELAPHRGQPADSCLVEGGVDLVEDAERT